MQNRRKFLSFLGLSPLIGGGAVLALQNNEHKPDNNVVNKSLILYNENKQMCAFYVSSDGCLWINTNNTWEKVATE